MKKSKLALLSVVFGLTIFTTQAHAGCYNPCNKPLPPPPPPPMVHNVPMHMYNYNYRPAVYPMHRPHHISGPGFSMNFNSPPHPVHGRPGFGMRIFL